MSRVGAARRAARRGRASHLPFAILAAVLLALALGACGSGGGGGGGTDTVAAEKEADAEILNRVLARQLGAVGAYPPIVEGLRGRARAFALRFRTQEQEHADAVIKAIRGLGASSTDEVEEIDVGEPRTRADRLSFLYEMEGVSLAFELRAITHLEATWPRALLGSIVANRAQHRLQLRELLGVAARRPLPRAFEDGTEPELPPQPSGDQG